MQQNWSADFTESQLSVRRVELEANWLHACPRPATGMCVCMYVLEVKGKTLAN